jgi:hypothetical protein
MIIFALLLLASVGEHSHWSGCSISIADLDGSVLLVHRDEWVWSIGGL